MKDFLFIVSNNYFNKNENSSLEGDGFYFAGDLDKKYTFYDKNYFVFIYGEITNLSYLSQKFDHFYDLNAPKFIANLYINNIQLEEELIGSYLILIFDINRSNLKLVRDQWGTKTLFYSINNEFQIFSSDLIRIKTHINSLSININRLIDYLSHNYTNHEYTFFNEVKRLPPAHVLKSNKENISIYEYHLSKDLIEFNRKNLNHEFDFVFESVVQENIIKSDNIGIMLSGGLDSSAIAVSMKNLGYKNIKTFSANFSHIKKINNIDERSYQQNVSSYTGYKHFNEEMNDISPIKDIKDIIELLGEPIMLPNLYIFNHLMKKIKKEKIEIIVDGNDGDNTISHGFEVFYENLVKLNIYNFFKEVAFFSKNSKKSFFSNLLFFLKEFLKKIYLPRKIKPKTKLVLKSYLKKNFQKTFILDSHNKKLKNLWHIYGNETRFRYFSKNNIINISPFYDPMLAKVISNGKNREQAIDTLKQSLQNTALYGVKNNGLTSLNIRVQ